MDYQFKCACGAELHAEITCTSGGCEAKLYGPPENCYPAEGPEFEQNEDAVCDDCGNVYDTVVDDHYDEIEEEFRLEARSNAEGPEHDED